MLELRDFQIPICLLGYTIGNFWQSLSAGDPVANQRRVDFRDLSIFGGQSLDPALWTYDRRLLTTDAKMDVGDVVE